MPLTLALFLFQRSGAGVQKYLSAYTITLMEVMGYSQLLYGRTTMSWCSVRQGLFTWSSTACCADDASDRAQSTGIRTAELMCCVLMPDAARTPYPAYIVHKSYNEDGQLTKLSVFFYFI